jgi:hypothetical protein
MLILLIRRITVKNELWDGGHPLSGSSPGQRPTLQSLMYLVFTVNEVKNPKIAVSVESKPATMIFVIWNIKLPNIELWSIYIYIYVKSVCVLAHLCVCVCESCHFHVPIVLKSGSLKFLEHSGLLKACNGIALPLNVWCMVEPLRLTVVYWLSNKCLKELCYNNLVIHSVE